MKPINTSIYDFPTLIQGGFVYVDKTAQIYEIARPDAVLRTEKGIYVFEFKFKSTAKTAIRQCRERNYAAAFEGDSRPVYYVGVNYSPRKNLRTVNDVVCERA